jgi:NAD(P)-dependent dehydrogenase (short-subunit alcohol dehydrogenase family)
MPGQGRVAGKVAVVVGGGQSPGAGIGNGRAAALVLAREGAKVLVADLNLSSAEETAQMINAEGGTAAAAGVDVTQESTLERLRDVCLAAWHRLDILHYNVGIYLAGGDAPILDIEAGAFSHVMDVNLRGMLLAAKHVLPVMREQRAGVITNVGSIAAIMTFPTVAYKTSKAGVVALTEHVAIANAAYGIRANVILPGLIETPMAVEPELGRGVSREEVIAQRKKRIPLKGRGGQPWDVAYAALYLASDEAGFVTGASLRVDGGQTLLVG